MKKTLCTFLLISALSGNSPSLFSQTNQVGECGELISVLFKLEKNDQVSLQSPSKLNEEFCDYGRNEKNANFEISFLDQESKIIYNKLIYLNPFSFHETLKKNNEFKKINVAIEDKTRIVKIPLTEKFKSVKYYQIKNLKDETVSVKKNFNWEQENEKK